MKTWICILVAVLGVTPAMLCAEEDDSDSGDKPRSTSYEKNLIKNRASKFKDTGGKSASGDLYIYVDDKQVDQQLKEMRSTSVRERSGTVDIGSPLIKKEDKVKSVTVVVDLKKETKIDTGKATTVNVANPQMEEGAKAPKKVNSIIEMKKLKVE